VSKDAPDEQPQLTWLWKSLYAPDGSRATCRSCGSLTRFHRLKSRPAYTCDRCGTQIRPTAGTLFAGSSTPLATWFEAIALLAGTDEPPSRRELAVRLGIDYKAAWRIARRVQEAAVRGGSDEALIASIAATWHAESHAAPTARPSVGDGDHTVDRIRAAACRALAKRGLARTRIADIAAEADVSSAIVHYYFRSKDEVLLSALMWAGEQLQSSLEPFRDDTLDPLTQLRHILRLSVPADEGLKDEFMLWLDFWNLVRIDVRYLPECQTMSARWKSAVLEVLQRGTDIGVFQPAAPLNEVCQMYVCLAESLSYRCVLGYDDAALPRVLELLAAFLAQQLNLLPAQLQPTGTP